MSRLQFSARRFQWLLKLARKIADLPDSETIQPAHLAEALRLRPAEAANALTRLTAKGPICC